MNSNLLITTNSRLQPHWTNKRYYGLVKLRQAIENVIDNHIVQISNNNPALVAVDLGCGTMPYRSLFEPFVSKYWGADISINRLADFSMDSETNRVELPTDSADFLISTQVLEHVESPSAYLTEASRICKPGGLLILSTHGFFPYHPNPKDYWRWTASGLRKLLQEQGWQVIEVIGILGFAAASVRLLQDALEPKIPRPVRGVFTVCLQQCVGILDHFYSPEGRQQNASIYLMVARNSRK